MPYKTIKIASLVLSVLITFAMIYGGIDKIFSKIGVFIAVSIIMFAGVFFILSLTRIENKSFRIISYLLAAFTCVYAVLKGVYIENNPVGTIIFSAVFVPAFFALILNAVSYLAGVRKK